MASNRLRSNFITLVEFILSNSACRQLQNSSSNQVRLSRKYPAPASNAAPPEESLLRKIRFTLSFSNRPQQYFEIMPHEPYCKKLFMWAFSLEFFQVFRAEMSWLLLAIPSQSHILTMPKIAWSEIKIIIFLYAFSHNNSLLSPSYSIVLAISRCAISKKYGATAKRKHFTLNYSVDVIGLNIPDFILETAILFLCMCIPFWGQREEKLKRNKLRELLYALELNLFRKGHHRENKSFWEYFILTRNEGKKKKHTYIVQ